jgi:hypothetical protein
MGYLIPARTCYPDSMLRPEQLSEILRHSPKLQITHTQILTSLWAELERSLGESETENNTIARIKAESKAIKEIAERLQPRQETKAQSRDQKVIIVCPYLHASLSLMYA